MKQTLGCFSLVCFLLSSSLAFADDKVLSGSACIPAYDSYLYSVSPAAISNSSSTTDEFFTCPIVRDVNIGSSSGQMDDIKVYLEDSSNNNNSNAQVYCAVWVYDTEGVLQAVNTQWGPDGTYTGEVTLDFPAFTGSGYGVHHYFNIDCRLPRTDNSQRSSIYSYFWRE